MTRSSRHAMWLSFACGFASLSLEILWVRLYGFTHRSTPGGFGFVLMAYLLGIALGAYAGSGACNKMTDPELWLRAVQTLLLSAVAALAMPRIFGWTVQVGVDNFVLDILLIGFSSALLAYVFPIAHHLGANGFEHDRQGRRFASVYLANVLGAALGPLSTGYVALEVLSLQQCFAVLGAVQAACGVLLLLTAAPSSSLRNLLLYGAGAAGLAGVAVLAWAPPHGLIGSVSQAPGQLVTVVENRHGIITIARGRDADDIVYGGNVYDGRTNVDLVRNSNGLHRVAILSALQPEPRRVLMVGLSIGSWLALIRNFPGVEEIDVIEINDGYLDAARAYPAQEMAMADSRVRIHIDDARRWLRMNPSTRYDLVIMNTTWHWRANTSLLLSRDYLQLIKAHMRDGAVMAFNATGSPDAFHTAAGIFLHAYQFGNFVYGADFDFRYRKDNFDPEKFLQIEGALTVEERKKIQQTFAHPFVSIEEVRANVKRPLETVTDLNMITEFRYGAPSF